MVLYRQTFFGHAGGMKIESYLKREGLTQREFARQAGVAHSTITRLIKRKINPSREMVARIVEASGNAIRPNDLFDHG
jgi:transcriptional regulator with XRE-family HTH domain